MITQGRHLMTEKCGEVSLWKQSDQNFQQAQQFPQSSQSQPSFQQHQPEKCKQKKKILVQIKITMHLNRQFDTLKILYTEVLQMDCALKFP